MRQLFNNDWFFSQHALTEGFSVSQFSAEKNWDAVDIPHDWLIKDVNDLYMDSEGWYKKCFDLTEISRTVLHFGGIYMDSRIYINDKLVKIWKNGYTSFSVDITEYIKLGENEIYVRVIYKTPNSRWYTGAGIYRNVWIEKTGKSYIKTNGIYSNVSRINDSKWKLSVYSEIKLENSLTLFYELKDANGKIVASTNKNMTADSSSNKVDIFMTDPELWSIDSPYLYELKTSLVCKNKVVDTESHKVGFREINFSANKGLFLNNLSLKIHGVCLHHDLGALGSAFSKAALKRQLVKLKEMGVNAIRTAHNPAAPELFHLADEMGFLVQSEFTDVWKHAKTKYDYSKNFEQCVEEDVKSWVTRDRNHPSVFMWSIGNEVYDTHGREDGTETLIRLRDLTRKWDYRHNAPITFASNYLEWEPTQQAAQELELVGYNYGEKLYEAHHKKYPNWIIYGSETCAVVQSRGVYHFPLSQNILTDDDLQCSSLGNSPTSWGAKSIESCLILDRDCPFSLGQFLWSGIDYIGEPTPYHTKNSYFGQLDTAVLEKDSYYIFQAAWTNYKKNPMIHIFPYWDFVEDQLIDVRVSSNAPIIELFFNGKSLGKRKVDREHGNHILEDWQINYMPGELVAIGYDKNNHPICADRQVSFGESAQIKIALNKDTVLANGQDLIFTEISTVDNNGNPVQNACDRIQVEVEGPARLLGIDNGDSTDFDQYQTNSRCLFSGKMVAIIAPTLSAGEIKLKFSSQHLSPVIKKITSLSVPIEATIGESTALTGISGNLDVKNEVLVRKIDLKIKKSFDSTHPQAPIVVEAEKFPKNSDFQDLLWRVTDEKGIDSRIVEYEYNGNQVVVHPKANGTIYIRCGVRNNKKHIDRYSMIQLSIDGLEEMLLDPYQAISGGLYSRSNVDLTSGNDRGVATLRGEESWVIFDDLDFGKNGSNELSMWLFPLENNPFPIEIWKGIPNEIDSERIDTVIYTKGSVWNTYQIQTFQLRKEIQGITTITFIFQQKVHIQKFKFSKKIRNFATVSATDYDLIYGDSYKLTKKSVDQIGNNVTLKFEDFHFDQKVSGLILSGKSNAQRNTIRVKISNKGGEQVELLEFPNTNKFENHNFNLEILPGIYDIEFIFLPGSSFDFLSFKFLSDDCEEEKM